MWEGVNTFRRCDTLREVKYVKKVYQLMESCNGHGGDVMVLGEVWQFSKSVTVIREV